AALSHWLARSARSRDPGGSLATPQALVAQWTRASDYGSEGWGFESLRARQPLTCGFTQESLADLRRCRPPSSSRCCQTYPVVSLPVGETRGKPVPQGVLVGDFWGTTPGVRW